MTIILKALLPFISRRERYDIPSLQTVGVNRSTRAPVKRLYIKKISVFVEDVLDAFEILYFDCTNVYDETAGENH